MQSKSIQHFGKGGIDLKPPVMQFPHNTHTALEGEICMLGAFKANQDNRLALLSSLINLWLMLRQKKPL